MPWLTENRERLAQFRAGDPSTLGEVYSQYATGLARSLAEGITIMVDGAAHRFKGAASAFDLDDIVQEAFIRAFNESARNAYDGLRAFHPWLVTIARNLLVDRFRQGTRTAALFASMELTDEPVDENPEDQLAQAQLKRAYADFVASLDEQSRILIRMRFEQNDTRRTVTEATGLSAMQVRSREAQLRKRFFQVLLALGYAASVLVLLLGGT